MRCDCRSPSKILFVYFPIFQTAWKRTQESTALSQREIIEALVKHDTERAVEMLQKDILNVKSRFRRSYSL